MAGQDRPRAARSEIQFRGLALLIVRPKADAFELLLDHRAKLGWTDPRVGADGEPRRAHDQRRERQTEVLEDEAQQRLSDEEREQQSEAARTETEDSGARSVPEAEREALTRLHCRQEHDGFADLVVGASSKTSESFSSLTL